MLATFYVDDSFVLQSDPDSNGLDAGDTVTFQAGAGSAHSPSTVPNLTFGGNTFTAGANAFTSIQAAVDAAAANGPGNDLILVGRGIFNERVNVNTQVTLLGNQAGVDATSARGPEAIVQGINGETAFFVTANNVIIDGFTVQNTTSATTFGSGITLGANTSGHIVRNNIIQNNLVGIGLGSDDTLITQNLIINNNVSGPAGGTGIYSDNFVAGGSLTNVTITENTISGHTNAGIVISPLVDASNSNVFADDIEISCNIMHNNGTAVVLINTRNSTIDMNEIRFSEDAAILLDGGNSNITVTNNIIAEGNAQGILIGNTPFFTTGVNSNISVNFNSISGNAGAGLQVDSGAYTGALNAESNWWGAASGPTISSNAGGTGQAIVIPASGVTVDFTPFLTSGVDADPEECGFQVVVVSADLSVTKTASASTVAPGDTLTFTIIVRNNSADTAAQNLTVTEQLPAGVTLLNVSAPGWNPPAAVGEPIVVTSTRNSLAAGATSTLVYTVRVDEDVPVGTQLNNRVTVSANTSDNNTGNNVATTVTTVVEDAPPVELECEVTTDNVAGASRSANIVDDADSGRVLIVTGTSSNDTINVDALPGNRIRVRMAGLDRTFDQDVAAESFSRIVIFGQNGNDKITVAGSLDVDTVIFGGAGNDTITGGNGDDQIDGGTGNDTINGGGGNDVICGGNGNDTINGGAGDDLLGGDAGNDRIKGDTGNDVLLGDQGNDDLDGGLGDDMLFGREGNDKLTGQAGNDILVGGSGNDQLDGGIGVDILIGGVGTDTLRGGTGADLLIGGSTQLDEDATGLEDLLTALAEDDEDAVRNALGDINGDNAADSLFGQGDLDWFFTDNRDSIRDRASGERVN